MLLAVTSAGRGGEGSDRREESGNIFFLDLSIVHRGELIWENSSSHTVIILLQFCTLKKILYILKIDTMSKKKIVSFFFFLVYLSIHSFIK